MNKAMDNSGTKDLVVARDLQMIYRVGKVYVPALRGIDIEVRKGELIAVMGPSGCGKSTLLHIIGGLLHPTAGQVYIDGTDIVEVSEAQRTETRRRKIGFVFQRYNLMPTLTASDNIRLAKEIQGNSGRSEHDTEQLLTLLGLQDKMHHKPSELSGGEQQRVAIARAVVNCPAILLADEPTGNLDSSNSKIVLHMMRELNQTYQQTTVVITHNPEVASFSDRTIQMRDGKIDKGDPQRLFSGE